jgi:Icc-related predicted phosphoesterase
MLSGGESAPMKILAVSDQVVDRLYALLPQGHFDGIDLIIGCGDLPYDYLEYMVSTLNVALYYVPGNHDPAYNPQSSLSYAEGGCNLDLKGARVQGLLLAGFGGSVRYRPDGVNQYDQGTAFVRAAGLMPTLTRNRLLYGRALDVLVTHSPAYGVHDEESHAHRGLKAINWLLRWARPRYHLHGHTHHLQRNLMPDTSQMGTTCVMNVYPYRVIEIADVR